MGFSNRDIADYYNQTQVHYRKWWKLDEALAVHYGMWDGKTRNFGEALSNTNQRVAAVAGIRKGERVLDAGCGVGGSAFFLARHYGCRVTGLTLSEKQIAFARQKNLELQFSEQVDFLLEDYSNTSLQDQTFDLVWAIESLTSAPDKKRFCDEARRLLKPGGRIVVADYFRTPNLEDKRGWMRKWQNCWSLSEIMTESEYVRIFGDAGFALKKNVDATSNIFPSARIMYRAYLMGAIPSLLYNTFHRTSRFARTHYLSGKYQYRALKEGLWKYKVMLFVYTG